MKLLLWISSCVFFFLTACMGSVTVFSEDALEDIPGESDVSFDTHRDTPRDLHPDGADDAPVDTTAEDIIHDTAPDLAHDPEADLQDLIPDIDPELCVPKGCLVPPDISIPCCSGLSPHNNCLPGDTGCSSEVLICIDCGNFVCDPHETPWSCPGDCPSACELGFETTYYCAGLENWSCTCIEDPCKPRCGVSPPLWYDPCSGASLGMCLPGMGVAECVDIGTAGEGWYDITLDYMIVNTICEPRWDCHFAW